MVDHLRDACMEQLTRSPGERRKEILLDVLDDPALRSSLLPNITIRSMIQRLSTRALREIESQGSIFVYHEIVSRELSSRQKSAAVEYSKFTNDEILDIKARFDTIQKERRECFRSGSWYPSHEDLEEAEMQRDAMSSAKGDESGRKEAKVEGKAMEQNEESNILIEPMLWREPPFAKILDYEMERRRKYATVKINRRNLPNMLMLDSSDTVVTLVRPHQYGTGHATLSRKAKAFGKWLMEFTIVHFPVKESSISVGLDVPRAVVKWKPDNKIAPTPRGTIETVGQVGNRGISMPGITRDDVFGRAGIAWKSDGKKEGGVSVINVAGKTFSEPESFTQGDVLTFAFDQDNVVPRIQIYKNGEKLIPTGKCQEYLRNHIVDSHWKEKREHIHLEDVLMEGDLPIVDYNNYELLPSVSMYSSLRHGLGNPAVRCNFTGPFRYPIEGFEGYGADISSRRRNSMQRK